MNIIVKISLIVGLPLVFNGCLKDDNFPVIPEIELISYQTFGNDLSNPDSAWLKFSFKDGDGDLGTNDENAKNCFLNYFEKQGSTVKDYPEFERSYRLPSLTPNAQNKSIEGEITISIKPPPIYNPLTDSAYGWKCYVIDRAGNESNEIITLLQNK